jgi:hypothetical protein
MSILPEPTPEQIVRAEEIGRQIEQAKLVNQIATELRTYSQSMALNRYLREAERQQQSRAVQAFNLKVQQDGRNCRDLNRKTYEARKEQFLAALRGRAPR